MRVIIIKQWKRPRRVNPLIEIPKLKINDSIRVRIIALGIKHILVLYN